MATLASPSPPTSPSITMRRKGWARKCERYCCSVVTYFPLAFVYGLTTWAVWVEAGIGMVPAKHAWTGTTSSALGILLYLLLNWSYTTAVFTDPGSPLNTKDGYNHLPTRELAYTSFTVKSDGGIRFCNKCQAKKPDRAHHCSTCRRCVLKMDHHCPWLATCVGLYNYKAFVLFLVYLTLFCWVCFAASSTWVWSEVLSDNQYTETMMPVNYVLLAVISGIIGIVITGFTIWHLYLAATGQTTIESLEKTRYLSPLRNTMKIQLHSRNYVDPSADSRPSLSDQLREIHANALPSITRPEEGESSPSHSRCSTPQPNSSSNGYSHPSYSNPNPYEHRERQRDIDRYDSYLDEKDSESLPNAFDLGWRRNLSHVFGPSPLLWGVPICNTTGDGWTWDASPKWLAARESIRREREKEARIQKERERAAGWGVDSPTEADMIRNSTGPYSYSAHSPAPTTTPQAPRRPEWQTPGALRDEEGSRYLTTTNGVTTVPKTGRRSPGKADQILGRERGMYSDNDMMPLRDLARRKVDVYGYEEDEDVGYDTSSDEEAGLGLGRRQAKATKNWNDIPEDFLGLPPKGRKRGVSSGVRREGGSGNGSGREGRGDAWAEWDGDT
ncbi:zf-DHHC-domain-containing protein [Lepidopterella palustris CBS 459.81]|uniref:Palmitoyltransferase n=1 Tax=Lepidopterella palustris CBS 459.81 TaxID=1314670 RepID=A0A8E2JJ87_9PEZI|nr:zf-DHHC-domain-containing protein [Lepidopterella palustris CBS 459.81]